MAGRKDDLVTSSFVSRRLPQPHSNQTKAFDAKNIYGVVVLPIFLSKRFTRPEINGSWRRKLILYKTLIRPVVLCGTEAWTLKKKEEKAVLIFERKIFRIIYGPIQIEAILDSDKTSCCIWV